MVQAPGASYARTESVADNPADTFPITDPSTISDQPSQEMVKAAKNFYNRVTKKKSHEMALQHTQRLQWNETGVDWVNFMHDEKVSSFINEWVRTQR